jgi:cell division protein FtsN
MANYERRVYEPSDEVRVFDGSEEEDDVEGSRLPLLIVLALLVLAMFAGVVWLAYRQGVARGRGETPILTAAAGPERVAPQQPGGTPVPYQGFKIYEQPAPPDDGADNAGPAAAPAAAPAKPPAAATQAPKPAPVAKVQATPAKPVAAAKPAAQPAPKSVASLIRQADKPAPPPAMKQSVPPAKAAAAPAPVGGLATGAPRQLASAAPATPAPAPAAAKPAAPAAGGAYVLQIGAYKSQAEAEAAWKTYKARHAALLSGYSPDVKQADLGEKGTWYRLRVAGFSDREVASALCDRLKSDGGACILSR